MPKPAYQAIKDHILSGVQSGRWRQGDRVPSENELAARFNVARMTVNRALRELMTEQVLSRVQGAGTFVAASKHQSTLVRIRSIADEITERGDQHQARVLKLEEQVADARLAEEFGLAEGDALYHSALLHFENDEPIQLELRWVAPRIAPEYLAQDFTQITPSDYLLRVAPLQRVEYRIEAQRPAAPVRRVLRMATNEPALTLHRRTWSRKQVASVVDLWHPGSRYQFTGHF